MIKVNERELADEIASTIMDDRYPDEDWMEERKRDFVVKENKYDEYLELYGIAEQLIKNCEEE